MKNLSILEKSWVDLVFEHKNKNYGAYQLRLEHSKTMVFALFFASFLFVFAVSVPKIIGLFGKTTTVVMKKDSPPLVLVNLDQISPPLIENRLVLPKKKAAVISKNDNLKVAKKDEIVAEVAINKEVKSTENRDSVGNGAIVKSGSLGGDDIVISDEPKPNKTVFKSFELDKNPEFPGGINVFLQYVGNNFNSPADEMNQTLKIYVSFVVEVDGTMSHIEVKRDPGFGLGEEAIRVLKSIKTKWQPGNKDGLPVRAFYNLPISVEL